MTSKLWIQHLLLLFTLFVCFQVAFDLLLLELGLLGDLLLLFLIYIFWLSASLGRHIRLSLVALVKILRLCLLLLLYLQLLICCLLTLRFALIGRGLTHWN